MAGHTHLEVGKVASDAAVTPPSKSDEPKLCLLVLLAGMGKAVRLILVGVGKDVG